MPDIMTALKAEIVRLARKEAKAATDSLRKPAIATRGTLADLKRRVAELEKLVKQLGASLAEAPAPTPETAPASSKNWISGKGVRALRQKLGLSQEQFARLLGVGHNSVYKWESKAGMLQLRGRTKAAVMAARGLGAREAKARVAALHSASKRVPTLREG